MHRPRALLLAVLAVLAAPLGAAATGFQGQVDLDAGARFTRPLDAAQGDSLTLEWDASAPIDVLVLRSDEVGALDGNATPEATAQALNATTGTLQVTLPSAGPWTLVLDNTGRPDGGAPGSTSAHVEVSVTPVPKSPPATGSSAGEGEEGQEDESPPGMAREEAPTLWNALMFDAHHWETGQPIELAGVALWMIVLFAVACIGFASPPRLLAALAGSAALFVTLWALVPRIGELTEVGPPALAGLALAWVAAKRTSHARDALQLAFVAAVLGAFAGVLVAYGLRHLWSDPAGLVLGGRRFTDVLFTLPGFAVLGVILFKVIPDIVHAIDDANADGPRGARQQAAGQGEGFNVTCLRCRTEIKVDRSMKRFRVATDRFEFACPNCQYWMEWADPNAKGAAAA